MRKMVGLVCGGALALVAGGCRYMTYQGPDGRVFQYVNAGFDTKVGAIDVKTHDGTTVRVENVDSNSKALDVADSALKLLEKGGM